MSGGGGGVIIIQRLIESGEFTQEDCAKLREIQDRSPVRCSWRDSFRVARIVMQRIRRP